MVAVAVGVAVLALAILACIRERLDTRQVRLWRSFPFFRIIFRNKFSILSLERLRDRSLSVLLAVNRSPSLSLSYLSGAPWLPLVLVAL